MTTSATREQPFRNYVAGEWVAGDAAIDNGNPSDLSDIVGRYAVASAAQARSAIDAAKAAFPAWSRSTPQARADLLDKVGSEILARQEELGRLLSREEGKTLPEGIGEAARAGQIFKWFAGEALRLGGERVPSTRPGIDIEVTREALGVVGLITPWNAPLTILAFKLPAALAAGNTVVVKPSELAPFSTIRFAELALEAGLPPGVLNVVAGGPEAGDRLVRHPDVRKVSFTGGISTARKIIEASAETVTPLTLELGGKAANLLFADADLDQFVPAAAIMGMLAMSGQGCGCPTRLMVQDEIYDETLERLLAFAREATNAGDLLDPATTFGPLITEASCDRVLQIVDEARREGTGELLTGGGRMGGAHAGGFYVEPTVFTEVPAESPIAQMEIFGPVLSVMRFSTDEEAIELANSTTYGLGHFVNTRDLNRAHTLAAALEAGTVWVNGFSGAPPGTPLGGYRQSGFGREGGRAGLDEFLQVKNVYIAGIG